MCLCGPHILSANWHVQAKWKLFFFELIASVTDSVFTSPPRSFADELNHVGDLPATGFRKRWRMRALAAVVGRFDSGDFFLFSSPLAGRSLYSRRPMRPTSPGIIIINNNRYYYYMRGGVGVTPGNSVARIRKSFGRGSLGEDVARGIYVVHLCTYICTYIHT